MTGPLVATPPPAKRRKPRKATGRAARWAAAVAEARTQLEVIEEAAGNLETAMGDLRDLRDEFQGWLDNLPEGLQQSPVGEKLQAIVGIALDPEVDYSAVEAALDEADAADLPLGWGRD